MARASAYRVIDRAGVVVFTGSRAASRAYAKAHGGQRAGYRTNEWTVRIGKPSELVKGKYRQFWMIDASKGPINYADALKLIEKIPVETVNIGAKGIRYGKKEAEWQGMVIEKKLLRSWLEAGRRSGKDIKEVMGEAVGQRVACETLEAVSVAVPKAEG